MSISTSPFLHESGLFLDLEDSSRKFLHQDELRRHGCCCFIPPYLERLVSAGPEAGGLTVMPSVGGSTLEISSQLREQRVHHAHSIGLQGLAALTFAAVAAGGRNPTVSVASAQNGSSVNGMPPVLASRAAVVRTKDADAFQAFAGAEDSLDFWNQLFGRNSIDDQGCDIDSTVHFMSKYCNAFWNGTRMVYGDGDGQVFNSFTSDIDVIGHELAHGVTEYTLGLEYHNQAGALNESISDVFGSLFKQWKSTPQVPSVSADWLIGDSLIRPIGSQSFALRSMKAPGTAYINHPVLGNDPQPNHMSRYKQLPNTPSGDWGGVHINSGIPNRAFYLAAIAFGGFAWDKAGKIWYTVMQQQVVTAQATFVDFALATVKVANSLFGAAAKKIVLDAWIAVGVLTGTGGGSGSSGSSGTPVFTDTVPASQSLDTEGEKSSSSKSTDLDSHSPEDWIGRVDDTWTDVHKAMGSSGGTASHSRNTSSGAEPAKDHAKLGRDDLSSKSAKKSDTRGWKRFDGESSIIPPHMLQTVARNAADKSQRDAAVANLRQDTFIRQQREAHKGI